jgi:hypothetical protein
MSSGFFSNGVDLDNLFELASDFPQFPKGTDLNMFFIGGVDLNRRYLRLFGTRRADVGIYATSSAMGAYTEYINEGGEIITINYPAVPAGQKDLAEIFCPKGYAAGYIYYPYAAAPSPYTTYEHTINGTASGSGTLVASRLFTFDVQAVMLDQASTVTNFNLVSATLIGGSVYSALNKSGGISRPGNQVRYLQRYTVGLSTTTSYSGGYGSSEARYRLQFSVTASNGNSSTSAGTSHPTTSQIVTFDVVLYHYVSPSGGGQ